MVDCDGRQDRPAHQEGLVIAREVVIALAVAQLARQAEGQIAVRDGIAEIDARLFAAETVKAQGRLGDPFELRLAGHEIDRAARIAHAKQCRVGAPHHLDPLEGERLFAHPAHRAQRQTIAESRRLKAANEEVIVAVVGAIVIGVDAGRILQHLLGRRGVAVFHLLLGDHADRGGGVEQAGRDFAARPHLAGHDRAGVIIGAAVHIDEDGPQPNGSWLVLGQRRVLREGRGAAQQGERHGAGSQHGDATAGGRNRGGGHGHLLQA